METLRGDVRHSLRMLARSPGFTAVAVLSLALGIAGNTTIFSVVNAVLLRPLPYPEPDRLVMVRETSPRTGGTGIHLSPANFAVLKDETRAFAALGAYENSGVNLVERGTAERVEAGHVSSGLFVALGVNAARGRLFRAEDDLPGHTQVVLVSDRLWRTRFGSDERFVGRSLLLDGVAHTVVGVMPAGFEFPHQTRAPDLWVPLQPELLTEHAGARFLRVVGRLQWGFGIAQAEAEARVLARRLQARDLRNNDGMGLLMLPLRERIVGDVRTPLLVLLGAVAVVLLIACANVASLMLVRAAGRRREIAVRSALGASRARLVQQLLAEGLVLASLGGALGCLTAAWTLGALVAVAPPDLPRRHEIELDGSVLAFTLIVSVVSGALVALAPALRESKSSPLEALREAAGSTTLTSARTALRGALVVSEIALALPLVIAAGLLLRSFVALRAVDPGFRPDGVLTAQIALPASRYGRPEAIAAVYRETLARLGGVGGVVAVGGSTHFPFQNRWRNPVAYEGLHVAAPADLPLATVSPVTPGYFAAMGIALRNGRSFGESDDESSPPVAVIDEVAARRFFGSGDPLGKRVKLGSPDGPGAWLSVVGVARAVREAPDVEPIPEIYLPFSQIPRTVFPLVAGSMTFVVRTAQDPIALVPAVRAAAQAVDAEQPLFNVATLDERWVASRAQRRFQLALVGLFGGLALLLASVGLYGVVSHQTAQRTREIGLRMTLGARRHDVFRMVLGQGLKLVLLGAGVGFVAALSLTRLLATLLFGVGPVDLPTFLTVALLLVGAALIAMYLPARRAATLDPIVALRYE